MKKNKLRPAIIFLLVLVSLACYTFLNTVSIPSDQHQKEAIEQTAVPSEEEPVMVLPDVEFVKKILQKSRKILPAS